MKRIFIGLLFIIISLFIISCKEEEKPQEPEPQEEEPVTLEKIEVVSLGKTTYMMGEEFNPSGFVIKAFFSDESSKTIVLTNEMVTIDMTKTGENDIEINYAKIRRFYNDENQVVKVEHTDGTTALAANLSGESLYDADNSKVFWEKVA